MQLNSSNSIVSIPALTLPLEFRRFFAYPQGTLYIKPHRGEVTGFQVTVSVGDIVSEKHKAEVKIVDYKSKRRTYRDETSLLNVKKYRIVVNPPGTLSLNAMTIINNTRTGYIRVIGEEDLLVIPFLTRSDVSVVYGQPDVGVVLVKSDLNMALKILKILKPTVVTYNIGECL